MLLGKQGAGKGTQSTRLADHYGVDSRLDRRHVPHAGRAGHRVRARGEALHGRGRARARRDRRRRDRGVHGARRSARRRLRARRVPAHAPPGPRARPRDRGLPARPRHRSRRAARDRDRPHRGPARVRELPACVPREPAARRTTGRATRAGAGSASATTTPRRRSSAGSSCTSARRSRSSSTTASAGCSTTVDGVGEGDEVFERLVKVVRRAALVAARSPMVLRKTAAQIALDAARRRRRGRDARGVRARGRAGRDDRRSRPRRARGARAPGRPLELPRLPRVPGRGVRLAERGDRARHPRSTGCSRTATSSRSTAGRSSRAGTPTPRSPFPVGEVDAESQRLMDVTRAALESAIAATVAGNRLGDIGAAAERRGRRRRASGWCASTSVTASAPPCTRSPRCRTTGPAGRGLRLRAGIVLAIEPMVTAGRATTRTARRRLDRRDRRRLPGRALRAHRRHHRRRPRDPHRPVTWRDPAAPEASAAPSAAWQ